MVEKFGLNDSLPVQYLRYLKNIVTLDFWHFLFQPAAGAGKCPRASGWTLLLSVPTWIIGGFWRCSWRVCRMEAGKAV